MIDGAEAGERFSLVEHPMSPRALAAPLHPHTREDEYSYVLEGRVGALLGDQMVTGGPGELIFKLGRKRTGGLRLRLQAHERRSQRAPRHLGVPALGRRKGRLRISGRQCDETSD